MKKCTICKETKHLDDFNKKSKAKDGLQPQCRECSKKKSKDYYSRNKERQKKQIHLSRLERKKGLRTHLRNYLKDHHCVDCGESDIRVLEFDHVSGEKKKEVTLMVQQGYGIKEIDEEISKCEIRCCNCHRIKTYEKVKSWRCE